MDDPAKGRIGAEPVTRTRLVFLTRDRGVAWAVAVAAVALALLGQPRVVSAHAQLERAEPPIGRPLDAAPAQLRLTFSEPLNAGFSRIEVFDARRERVDRGDSSVAPDDQFAMTVSLREGLPDGLYTVAWRTLSEADGHTLNGAYPLIIGALPEGAELPESASEVRFAPETGAARLWLFLAGSVLFGTLLSWPLVFHPLFNPNLAEARSATARRARWLALMAATALLIGTLYAALAQAAVAADTSILGAIGSPVSDILTRGRYAAIWWARLALVLLTIGLLAWRGVEGLTGRLALAASAGTLLTSSLNSHSAALVSGPHVGVVLDWVHLMAVGAWIGGLASLTLVLPTAVDASGDAGERVLADAIRRFSNYALPTVVVLVVAGTMLAWLHVGSLEGLWQTGYGLSLVAKIGGLFLMLGLAAFNLMVVRPRMAGLAGQSSAAAGGLARRFAWAVRGEMLLAALVLTAAAVLTGLSPAREELARRAAGETLGGPVDRVVETDAGLRARVQIAPASVGLNRLAVQLSGVDPSTVERVQLTLSYLDSELGAQPLVLPYVESSSPPTWAAQSPLLSQPGTWQADLLVRQQGRDDARGALRFLVAGAGGSPSSPAVGASYPLLPSPIASLAIALGLAGVAIGAWGVWRLLRRPRASSSRGAARRARQGGAALAAAGLVAVLSAGYVYAQEQRTGMPLDVANVRSPVPPDAASLARGAEIYQSAGCAACHGDTGRGDGPAGLRLVPRPADFRTHMAAGHTDGQLFYWVTFGYPGSAMPGFADQLTEQERWDVINYIRTFADTGASPP